MNYKITVSRYQRTFAESGNDINAVVSTDGFFLCDLK